MFEHLKKPQQIGKASLTSLIERVQWVGIKKRSQVVDNRIKVNKSEVGVSFTRGFQKINPLPDGKADTIVVRVGLNVAYELNWRAGDIIYPCHHPDDHLLFLLTKTDSTNGYKLLKGINVKDFIILKFKWRNEDFMLDKLPLTIVNHEVYKDQLIFRID